MRAEGANRSLPLRDMIEASSERAESPHAFANLLLPAAGGSAAWGFRLADAIDLLPGDSGSPDFHDRGRNRFVGWLPRAPVGADHDRRNSARSHRGQASDFGGPGFARRYPSGSLLDGD